MQDNLGGISELLVASFEQIKYIEARKVGKRREAEVV